MAEYDVVVIGSGFGGSVTALRLAEKGYRVAVLEAGRRFADDELPETSWRLRRVPWAPAPRRRGVPRGRPPRHRPPPPRAGGGGGGPGGARTPCPPPPAGSIGSP